MADDDPRTVAHPTRVGARSGDSSIAALRARLLALDQARTRGALDEASHDAARRVLERALADAVLAAPVTETSHPTGPVARRPRPSSRLVAVVVLVVVAIGVAGYAFTGSPSLAGLGAPPPAPDASTSGAAPTGDREVGLAQIAEMVDRLAARLKERPDDAEGWTMLARSYTVLGRYRDALPAYQRASALKPTDAGLLADWADATAATNDGRASPESNALIARALAIDPSQPKALALAGTVAFDRGDYAAAVAQWQKIADALPPDSDFHRQVVANIDEARRRGNLPAPPAAKVAGAGAALASSSNGPPPTASPSSAGREALTGTVSLAPALAKSASPDDTVFVLARSEESRMPLAVFRATVRELPLRFRLDDTMAMTPTRKLSDTPRVMVAARVSKSGNAISQAGDLAGEIGPVAPGSHDLSVVIATVVPGR